VPEAEGDRKTVALFGGSFNPPHVGHVFAVAYARSVLPVDEVLIVPVYQHPFAKELAPFDDRLAMCRLALGWLPNVTVSAVERELGGESRTLRTIEHLVAERPSWRLRLLIGADVLADASKWHRFDRISELAPPLVLGRRGVDEPDAPASLLPQISSTEVRREIAKGEVDRIRSVVPHAVLEYISAHRLYRAI